MVRKTKRLWTDEEKRSICVQTMTPGVSVAQVARRYAINANMAAELGVEAHRMELVLDRVLRAHLAEMAEVKLEFR